jgi:hypothetical protein
MTLFASDERLADQRLCACSTTTRHSLEKLTPFNTSIETCVARVTSRSKPVARQRLWSPGAWDRRDRRLIIGDCSDITSYYDDCAKACTTQT